MKQLEEDIKLLKEMKENCLKKQVFYTDAKAEEKAKALENIIKGYNDLLFKNLKVEKFIREWIETAEDEWCSDINDYGGIGYLYKILTMLEGE